MITEDDYKTLETTLNPDLYVRVLAEMARAADLRRDSERLDWLNTEHGRGWVYHTLDNWDDIDRAAIDAAIVNSTLPST